MSRIAFQQALDVLEATVQEQGSFTLRSLRAAVSALQTQEVELCDEVVAFDDEIDHRYHQIQRLIADVLARQSPVASDLRLVLSMLHISIYLERIGDQCVTIAKLTKLAGNLQSTPVLVEGLAEMGERSAEMVRIALDALSERDVARSRELVDLDELINRTNRRVAKQVLALAAEPGAQEWGMRMIIVARCIERIGDNAVDIGEQTAFLVTGDFEQFVDASH
ncbi:MAG: phosphate signaling complex protein PhoU [Thermoleophilia bacterium]